MQKTARRILIVSVSAIAGGALVAGAAVCGLVLGITNAGSGTRAVDHPKGATLTVAYRDGHDASVEVPVRIGEVKCSYFAELFSVTAPSAEHGQALRVAGDDDGVMALILRFGDRAFIATATPEMDGPRMRLSVLDGQINEWNGRIPGKVIQPSATLSGTVTCDRVDR